MKIAISGKGGVGKTTLACGLALSFQEEGKRVILVDADPDMNLAATLGVSGAENIVPLAEMRALIAERSGVDDLETAPIGYFKLNPKVDDIPEKYALSYQGIKVLVMGTVKKGGAGCVCPENSFLRALLNHLVLSREEVVIVDLVAGIEPLGRATIEGIDALLIVVEPSFPALETAKKIKKLAEEIKIKNIFLIGNKIQNKSDEEFIEKIFFSFPLDILGTIKYNHKSIQEHRSLVEEKDFLNEVKEIKKRLTVILSETKDPNTMQ